MLVGNLVSIFVGGIITILWSFIANWNITKGEPSSVQRLNECGEKVLNLKKHIFGSLHNL